MSEGEKDKQTTPESSRQFGGRLVWLAVYIIFEKMILGKLHQVPVTERYLRAVRMRMRRKMTMLVLPRWMVRSAFVDVVQNSGGQSGVLESVGFLG